MVLDEDYLSPGLLTEKVQELYFTRQTYIAAMSRSQQTTAISTSSASLRISFPAAADRFDTGAKGCLLKFRIKRDK